jgi:hypothetical protein
VATTRGACCYCCYCCRRCCCCCCRCRCPAELISTPSGRHGEPQTAITPYTLLFLPGASTRPEAPARSQVTQHTSRLLSAGWRNTHCMLAAHGVRHSVVGVPAAPAAEVGRRCHLGCRTSAAGAAGTTTTLPAFPACSTFVVAPCGPHVMAPCTTQQASGLGAPTPAAAGAAAPEVMGRITTLQTLLNRAYP